MASNAESDRWRVKVTSLPESITMDELTQAFRLRASRIVIERAQQFQTAYAWINDFKIQAEKDETKDQNESFRGRHNIEPLMPSTPSSPVPGPTGHNTSPRHPPHRNTQKFHGQRQHVNPGVRHESTVSVVAETNDAESDRKPCPYANRSMYRFKNGECKYSHGRCPNYDECSQSDCRLAHARDMQSSACMNGSKCFNNDCSLEHPQGWSACADGAQCTDYDCISNHRPGRQKKCRNGNRCHTKNCQFLHPEIHAGECSFGTNCRKWNCKKAHPADRRQPCPNAHHCQDELCEYLHPPKRAEPPKNIMSSEVVQLSNAEYNFLELFGSKVLDKIRGESGMNVAQMRGGKLQLEGNSSTVANMKAYLKQTLHEQHVTITSTLWQYLQQKCKQSLWQRFVQKHRVGISFLATSTSAPLNVNNATTKKTAVDDRDEGARNSDHSDEDNEEDDDDDAKNDISPVTNASGHSQQRRTHVQQLIQVTLCSDLEAVLSKATEELGSYLLHIESWPLTQDEIKFILSQPQREKLHPQKKPMRRGQHSPVLDYINGLVRSGSGSIVQIFVDNKHGVWHVKVRGFKNHVKNAVSKIKTHLTDNVQTAVQLPVSKVAAIFLRTKAAEDVRKLERTHLIKITACSPIARAQANDEADDSNPDCLKLTGSVSRIKSAQEHIENFLESLSEQEKEFPCPSWDISRSIGQILRTRLKKIQESDDCEAIGWTRFYTPADRRDTTPKVSVSIVSFSEEAVDSVAEQCQDIVEGYVVWKPTADEFRAIFSTLIVKKSPPIDEFRQQWDSDIRLDRDTSTVTILARSKMIADDIREALLSLGKESRPRVTRVSEFIRIEPQLRRLANRVISSVLDEAKARKIFVESKNPLGLTLHGGSETVAEVKQKIMSSIDDLQGKVVTHRLQLSSLESKLVRADGYRLAKRIERETTTIIRDVAADTHTSSSPADDNGSSSSVITVTNSRGQTIIVAKGDITKAKNIDAIINAANGALYHAGGVDKVIADAAGPALDHECQQLIVNNGGLPIPAGKAVKTTAGNLPFKCVIHAIGPQYVDGHQQERPLLFSSIFKGLQLAEHDACSSVALPAVSSKTYGFPLAECTNTVVRALKQFFADYPQSKVRTVTLLDVDDATCSSFAREVTIDQSNAVLDNDDDLADCELPPLTAKWCWQSARDEKIYTDADARQIETAFQEYLKTSVIGDLRIGADNLRSGTIVNYSIQFRPDLKQLMIRDPNALNARLVCGHQMRVDTRYKREIIRYPLVVRQQQKGHVPPADYCPKPLDAYNLQLVTGKEYWTITGLTNAPVEQAQRAIQTAIQAATITESFSVSLNKDVDDHRKELSKIATQQQVQINFQQEGAGQLPMTLKGFKANVAEAKLKIALYAQDVLVMQVENDDELRTPKEWGDQKDGCKLVEITTTDSCFVRIEQRIKETLPNAKIEKIERVQNVRMWNHYAFRRRELKKELRLMPDLQVEMELFHGTRNTPPTEVHNGEYGFDMTFSTSGMWGIGSYFARNASYSCGAYAHTLPNGKKQVFFAQVLTGDVHDCPSDSKLRRPPKKNETVSGLRYNSVSGDTGGSKIYIVYENRVAYPTYLITFKK